jgi:hypothetical protein
MNPRKSKSCLALTDCYDGGAMRELTILFIHLIVTAAKLMRPGGGRRIIAVETPVVNSESRP